MLTDPVCCPYDFPSISFPDRGPADPEPASGPGRVLRGFGPALIVASVVIGPGSVLTASRIGCQFGYGLVWLVIAAAGLMVGMVGLAARLGVTLERTFCSELAARINRPVAAVTGLVVFLIIASFQAGNNIAVIAALEPLAGTGSTLGPLSSTGALLLLNLLLVAPIFGVRRLYRPLEAAMALLVGVMLIGFVGNLLVARPDLVAVVRGMIPGLPEELRTGVLPVLDQEGIIIDPFLPVQALIGTTFSVAAAFYQGYLVREKGWTSKHLRQGLTDSITGTSLLALISLVIMITSAAVLHGRVDPLELKSAADVARQLEPLFGPLANILFAVGIFCAAFSSFLVNAMIGGTVLSDGLGLGGTLDRRGPRIFTVVALAAGMIIAVVTTATGTSRVGLIIFAQALTVLGVPWLAVVLIWLGYRVERDNGPSTPRWLLVTAWIGLGVTLLLALRTGLRIVLQLFFS